MRQRTNPFPRAIRPAFRATDNGRHPDPRTTRTARSDTGKPDAAGHAGTDSTPAGAAQTDTADRLIALTTVCESLNKRL
jgi:hypothetical protein